MRQLRASIVSIGGRAMQQLRQLGDVGGDAPGLVAGEELGRRPSPRFILAIDVGQCLPVGVGATKMRLGLPARAAF